MKLPFTIAILTTVIYGQTIPDRRFEVASVKPGGNIFSTKPERSGGRFRWTTQLSYLVGYAYHLDFSRVSGPKCGNVYSVEATLDPRASDEEVRLMLQSLLAERFQLHQHRITAQADGYAMLVGVRGLKIKEAEESDESSNIAAIGVDRGVIAINGRRASMAQLAETLARVTRIPIWDRTGLSASYSFSFRFSQELSADMQADAPSLSTALKESLGLRLEKQKGTIDKLVIDSVAEPSEN